jgi:hypothetical protein
MRDAIDVLGLLTGWAAGYFLVNRNPWPWGLHPNHPGPFDLIPDERVHAKCSPGRDGLGFSPPLMRRGVPEGGGVMWI